MNVLLAGSAEPALCSNNNNRLATSTCSTSSTIGSTSSWRSLRTTRFGTWHSQSRGSPACSARLAAAAPAGLRPALCAAPLQLQRQLNASWLRQPLRLAASRDESIGQRGSLQRTAAQAAQSTGGEVDEGWREAAGVVPDNDVYYYEGYDDDDENADDQIVEVEDEDGSVSTTTIGSMVDDYVSWCNESIALEPYVRVERGNGGLPAVRLRHPNGSEVQVYLHGACVTSWTKPSGKQLLHVRPGNPWDGRAPISGGIPLAFPQYRRGSLPADGFLRYQHWSVVDAQVGPSGVADPCPTVVLFSESDEDTRELWPHDYEAFYTVSLGLDDDFPDVVDDPEERKERARQARAGLGGEEGEEAARQQQRDDHEDLVMEPESEDENRSAPPYQLTCTLQIRNTDDKPFEFCAALATHYATSVDLAGPQGRLARTLGLGGKYCLDWGVDPSGIQPVLRVEDQDYLYFGEDRLDRLYVNAEADKGDVLFCPGDRTHVRLMNRSGFKDIGAYHPQGLRAEDGTNMFVSLPCARAMRPVTLYPGEVWTGQMALRAYDYYWDTPLFDRGMQPMPPRKGTSI